MSETPSIVAPNKSKAFKISLKAVAGAGGNITTASPPADPLDDLKMIIHLCSPLESIRDLELIYWPLPSKTGDRRRFRQYDNNGCDAYETELSGTAQVFTELRTALKLISPSSVSIHYKECSFYWKVMDVLKMLKVQQALTQDLNNHNCDEDGGECGCDCYFNQGSFNDFIIGKVSAITEESMEQDSKRLYSKEHLKDKECPVLMEPLKIGETFRLNCEHLISRSAFNRIANPKKCPLCRSEAHIIESI